MVNKTLHIFGSSYENIRAVMVLIDCTVLKDVRFAGEDGVNSITIFCIGGKEGSSSSIYGVKASPWFDSLVKLNEFCGVHLKNYAATAVDISLTGEAPAKWFWSDFDCAN
jgi:hypothetical protein